MNIFEQLNILLMESDGTQKVTKSDIPIHPKMETKEQGEMAAAEKFLKLFQKLSAGSGGGKESVKDDMPEIPDDIIDPMLKKQPNNSKDKTFDKNKLTAWDEEFDEKIQKEVDVDDDNQEDDEFDDFDYKDNPFGDEDETEDDDQEDDDRSEDEKLNDTIKDALDSLDNDDDGDGGDDGDDSGANWGDDDDIEGPEGSEGYPGGGSSGGDDEGSPGDDEGSQGGEGSPGDDEGSQGGEGSSGGSEGSQGGDDEGGQPGRGTSGSETQSARKKRLEDLKKALDANDFKDFNDKIEDMKSAADVPKMNNTPGGQMNTPSDEDVRKDMGKSGLDDKAIDKIVKEKNIDTSEDYDEAEMEQLKKQVIDGLERSCKSKGGSALADTIVTNSLKNKITNDDWKEMLELFLKKKARIRGNLTRANNEIKWGHKNHLWRDAVLPTYDESKGSVQNIYCFVDWSGSVNKDLVHTFLGKVIDLCFKFRYTNVNIYGFADKLGVPRTINDKLIKKDGLRTALSQTWDFINSQNLGSVEQFKNVSEEINKIKRKDKDGVFFIFGDAEWNSVGNLKFISSNRFFKDMCVFIYYKGKPDRYINTTINILKEKFGVEHIITSKAETIFMD